MIVSIFPTQKRHNHANIQSFVQITFLKIHLLNKVNNDVSNRTKSRTEQADVNLEYMSNILLLTRAVEPEPKQFWMAAFGAKNF